MKQNSIKSAVLLLTNVLLLVSCTKESELLQTANTNAWETQVSSTSSTALASSSTAVVGGLYGVDLIITSGVIKSGKLEFAVSNQGKQTAGACKARITFQCKKNTTVTYIESYVDIPSIPGAGTVITRIYKSVPVPVLCSNSDIFYTITADYFRVVSELNETNNSYNGSWLYIY